MKEGIPNKILSNLEWKSLIVGILVTFIIGYLCHNYLTGLIIGTIVTGILIKDIKKAPLTGLIIGILVILSNIFYGFSLQFIILALIFSIIFTTAFTYIKQHIKNNNLDLNKKNLVFLILIIIIILGAVYISGNPSFGKTVKLGDGGTFQVPNGYSYAEDYSTAYGSGSLILTSSSSPSTSIEVSEAYGGTNYVKKVWSQSNYTVNGYKVREFISQVNDNPVKYSYDYYISKGNHEYSIKYNPIAGDNGNSWNFNDWNNPVRQIINSFHNP